MMRGSALLSRARRRGFVVSLSAAEFFKDERHLLRAASRPQDRFQDFARAFTLMNSLSSVSRLELRKNSDILQAHLNNGLQCLFSGDAARVSVFLKYYRLMAALRSDGVFTFGFDKKLGYPAAEASLRGLVVLADCLCEEFLDFVSPFREDFAPVKDDVLEVLKGPRPLSSAELLSLSYLLALMDAEAFGLDDDLLRRLNEAQLSPRHIFNEHPAFSFYKLLFLHTRFLQKGRYADEAAQLGRLASYFLEEAPEHLIGPTLRLLAKLGGVAEETAHNVGRKYLEYLPLLRFEGLLSGLKFLEKHGIRNSDSWAHILSRLKTATATTQPREAKRYLNFILKRPELANDEVVEALFRLHGSQVCDELKEATGSARCTEGVETALAFAEAKRFAFSPKSRETTELLADLLMSYFNKPVDEDKPFLFRKAKHFRRFWAVVGQKEGADALVPRVFTDQIEHFGRLALWDANFIPEMMAAINHFPLLAAPIAGLLKTCESPLQTLEMLNAVKRNPQLVAQPFFDQLITRAAASHNLDVRSAALQLKALKPKA